MKRQSMMKLLMVAAVAMMFMALKADVVDPPPRILSYAEWTEAMSSMSSSERSPAPFVVTSIMILVTAVVVIGCGCEIQCVARRFPIFHTICSTCKRNWYIVLIILLFGLQSWWFFGFSRVYYDHVCNAVRVSNVRPGETYGEYIERVREESASRHYYNHRPPQNPSKSGFSAH